VILQGLVNWEAGALEPAVALEVMEAAIAQGGPVGERARDLLQPVFDGGSDVVLEREWALAGGDSEAGRVVFQTVGDCQRCHGGRDEATGGHGGGAGPNLAGVSAKGNRYVLESVLLPGAAIADGFGSLVVTRHDGSQVSGLLVAESESEVQVDAGGVEPVTLKTFEIASRTEPTTGMPPMGLVLEPRALRDVMAYVMSLE
jgi:quinoprotein glucose dehydrogenase